MRDVGAAAKRLASLVSRLEALLDAREAALAAALAERDRLAEELALLRAAQGEEAALREEAAEALDAAIRELRAAAATAPEETGAEHGPA